MLAYCQLIPLGWVKSLQFLVFPSNYVGTINVPGCGLTFVYKRVNFCRWPFLNKHLVMRTIFCLPTTIWTILTLMYLYKDSMMYISEQWAHVGCSCCMTVVVIQNLIAQKTGTEGGLFHRRQNVMSTVNSVGDSSASDIHTLLWWATADSSLDFKVMQLPPVICFSPSLVEAYLSTLYLGLFASLCKMASIVSSLFCPMHHVQLIWKPSLGQISISIKVSAFLGSCEVMYVSLGQIGENTNYPSSGKRAMNHLMMENQSWITWSLHCESYWLQTVLSHEPSIIIKIHKESHVASILLYTHFYHLLDADAWFGKHQSIISRSFHSNGSSIFNVLHNAYHHQHSAALMEIILAWCRVDLGTILSYT